MNEVRLCGRLAAAPVQTRLPSGDAVVTFRLVVPRPPGRRRARPVAGRLGGHDRLLGLGCGAPAQGGQLAGGDLIRVEGALRRRFWQAQGGARSRYDVEVCRAVRERRAE